MTRARILADYVSGGTTAAEFDYLDGVTSNVQTQMNLKAPLASPAFTGTPSVTLGSDATGDVYYRAAGGALTRLATGADGTVLTSTGAGAVPAFEAAGGVAGNAAFMARFSTNNWVNILDNALLAFDDDSTGDSFDTDGVFNTSTGKFEVPATGVYIFYYAIYCGSTDDTNSWGFTNQSGEIDNQGTSANYTTIHKSVHDTQEDHIQNGTIIIPLSSGNTIWVAARDDNRFFEGHSSLGGCRLK